MWQAIKEAKHRLAREQGAVFKDWGGKIPIALIYPNSYYVGMSNLGFQTIYGMLNSYPHLVCERVFWEERGRESPLLSLETQRPVADFAILAFSVSYELDYFNVVQILKASGIPLLAAHRDETHPLVIAGGPCIMANPQPLACFFDCFAIGEAEVLLPSLLEVVSRGIWGRREELLQALSSLPGIYVPQVQEQRSVSRQWVRNLDDFATVSVVLSPHTEFGDMYLIEIERGCGRGCRFCLAGHIFRPARFRSLHKILAQAEAGLKQRKRLGLIGAAVMDHPQIEEMVIALRQQGARLSLSSMRIDALTEEVLQALAESDARTITLAPEAGSERLRKLVRKGVSEEKILAAIDRVARYNFPQLKLYFMVGLPGETEQDVEEIVRLALACQERLEKQRARSQLILNVAPFVPKAGTPYERVPMASAAILEQRLKRIKIPLRRKGIGVKTESVSWSLVQGMLARGDARLGAVLAQMPRKSLSAWHSALEACGLDAGRYIHRELSAQETLPWAMLH